MKLFRTHKVTIVTTIFCIVFIAAGYFSCKTEIQVPYSQDFYPAKVVSVGETEIDEFSLDSGATTIKNRIISFVALPLDGPMEGMEIDAIQYIDFMYPYQPAEVSTGDRIILTYTPEILEVDPDESPWSFIEHDRIPTIMFLGGAFFLLIIIIGRGKGFTTLISLVSTTAVIFAVYLPSIIKGINIYLSTSIIAIFIITTSLVLINNLNTKTFCAIMGNIGGVVVTATLAIAMNEIMGISGIVEQDYVFLMSNANPIDLKAVVWGGIVIGSLGAIMDVAMTIASSMQELAENMVDKKFKILLRSGMNIGRDAIGTMTNTLILAYIGGSMATVLLLLAFNRNMLFLFNMEMILVEILQAVIGSIGILFAVPVTAVLCAHAYTRDDGRKIEISE